MGGMEERATRVVAALAIAGGVLGVGGDGGVGSRTAVVVCAKGLFGGCSGLLAGARACSWGTSSDSDAASSIGLVDAEVSAVALESVGRLGLPASTRRA